jgi:hypothetical protein
MLTRRVELRSPVPPVHQATPYPTHLPAPIGDASLVAQSTNIKRQQTNFVCIFVVMPGSRVRHLVAMMETSTFKETRFLKQQTPKRG